MTARRVGLNLLIYLGWLGAVFAVLFALRSRFFPNPSFPPQLLFLIASVVASGSNRSIRPDYGGLCRSQNVSLSGYACAQTDDSL